MKKPHSFQNPKCAKSLNEKAFTLIEVLIAFSIFSTIIFFMLPIFQIILNTKENQATLQAMEWEVFCSQIKKEIRMSSGANIVSGRLILTNDNETVIYEKYGSNLRRRVNSTGHEIILQNVAQNTFLITNNVVKVSVIDTRGKEYSVAVHSLVNWTSSP